MLGVNLKAEVWAARLQVLRHITWEWEYWYTSAGIINVSFSRVLLIAAWCGNLWKH